MRDFIARGHVLGRMETGSKALYTAFLVFLLLGIGSAALLHGDGLGTDAATAAAYWRGDEAQMTWPKSYRQLLELTHFHLFTEPVVWLVVSHLYGLGSARGAWRVGLPLGTLIAIAAQIALPWLVVYAGAGWAALLLPAHLAMGLGLAWMAAAAIRDMWWSPSS